MEIENIENKRNNNAIWGQRSKVIQNDACFFVTRFVVGLGNIKKDKATT